MGPPNPPFPGWVKPSGVSAVRASNPLTRAGKRTVQWGQHGSSPIGGWFGHSPGRGATDTRAGLFPRLHRLAGRTKPVQNTLWLLRGSHCGCAAPTIPLPRLYHPVPRCKPPRALLIVFFLQFCRFRMGKAPGFKNSGYGAATSSVAAADGEMIVAREDEVDGAAVGAIHFVGKLPVSPGPTSHCVAWRRRWSTAPRARGRRRSPSRRQSGCRCRGCVWHHR